jgi:predicted patatin/cPLA2 family phospholipase
VFKNLINKYLKHKKTFHSGQIYIKKQEKEREIVIIVLEHNNFVLSSTFIYICIYDEKVYH